MCRSIKTLRPPFVEAAALRYVRKISGFRAPAPHTAQAFDDAVEAVAAATRDLLDRWRCARPQPAGALEVLWTPTGPGSPRPVRLAG